MCDDAIRHNNNIVYCRSLALLCRITFESTEWIFDWHLFSPFGTFIVPYYIFQTVNFSFFRSATCFIFNTAGYLFHDECRVLSCHILTSLNFHIMRTCWFPISQISQSFSASLPKWSIFRSGTEFSRNLHRNFRNGFNAHPISSFSQQIKFSTRSIAPNNFFFYFIRSSSELSMKTKMICHFIIFYKNLIQVCNFWLNIRF